MIFIDYETRSKCDLKKAGAWKYSLDPSTEVLCMAYAIDDGEVQLWKPGEEIPLFAQPLTLALCGQLEGEEFEAHSAFFERSIWQNTLKWPKAIWSCSAAKCAAHSLPRALDKAGEALGLSIRKDQEGKRVMMKMCRPRKPSKHNPSIWNEDPQDFQTLYKYCMDDVRAERALSHALRDLNKTEKKVWQLDQIINERGIRVDAEAVDAAIRISEEYIEGLNREISEVTNNEVNRASEAAKLTKWVQSQGVNMDSVAEAKVTETLTMELPDRVRIALEIRQKASKTSVAKYRSIKSATAKDDRIRGLFMYCGAGPGRWTGKIVQTQNLPRNNFTGNLDNYFEILKSSTLDTFEFCYPNVMNMMSKLIRPCLIASEGKTLFGGDYASIEARVLFWLAGDESALDVFREGGNIYKSLSGDIYNLSEEEAQAIPKSDKRYMVGKQGILGLGYNMGAEKFQETCANYGIHIDIEAAQKVVDTYREKYIKVKNLWYAQERAAMEAMKTGQMVFCGKIGWGISEDFLYCKLPSKRLIAYYKPELRMVDTPWGKKKESITYMHTNSVTRKWERTKTYGGKIVENMTQGVARDLMAEAMLRIEDADYEIVMHTHDEITAEKEEGFVEEFERLMSELPEWATGIPVEVEGWEGKRYIK